MAHVGDKTGPERTTGAAARIVSDYLTALYAGDFDTARALVTDDFSFRGPFIETSGKDAFFKGAEGLKRIARGHSLLRQWVDGDNVCSMSEWHAVRGGQLASGLVLFDSAAFRKLVPGP